MSRPADWRLSDNELEAYAQFAAAEHDAPLEAIIGELQAARRTLAYVSARVTAIEAALEATIRDLGDLGQLP